YFHVAGSNGPVLTAPAGAVVRALLSRPAGAASGNAVVPGCALLAYGSALGRGGGCCAGACVCAANRPMPSAPTMASAMSQRVMIVSLEIVSCGQRKRRDAGGQDRGPPRDNIFSSREAIGGRFAHEQV